MNETREHILQTAFALFLQKSFKEVTMTDILEKTGLSKGGFYHHFKSKEQLFLEIAEQFIFAMHNTGYQNLPDGPFSDFYRAYLQNTAAMMEMLYNDPRFQVDESNPRKIGMNYYTLILDAIKLIPELQAKMHELDAKELNYWRTAIARARQNGEIRSAMSDEQIAKIFIYTNDGVGIRILLDGSTQTLGPQLLQLWDAFYADLSR